MGFYNMDLDSLSEYTGKSIEELKAESYSSLETMIKDMQNNKIIERNNRNAKDEEYERLVLKYFEPVDLLRHWFDDKEIVLACARNSVTEKELCTEVCVSPGGRCHYSNAEYIRTSLEAVPQYDSRGNELMEREHKTMDVYRIANTYQGLCHGKVILSLLYARYPELAQFGFSAYGMSGGQDYEIYPANDIYTSITALLSGDVDWIIHRNREYCKFYNKGRYTLEECNRVFRTGEALKMFDVIRKIGEKEREAGHSAVIINGRGALKSAHGLKESKTSSSANVMILSEQAEKYPGRKLKFKLKTTAPYTVECLLKEYLEMTGFNETNVHIYHVEDYFGERGINLKTALGIPYDLVDKSGFDVSGYIVCSTFGWTSGSLCDLTIRINCPEINR